MKYTFLKFQLIFMLICLSAVGSFAASNESLLKKKSTILIEKGLKAEKKGDIETAVASFEEAYNVYPKNVLPLLMWGKLLYSVGMYDRANEVLKKIPLNKLPNTGQAIVHNLFGKIAMASKNISSAAISFSNALKADKQNGTSRIRLAVVNLILGNYNRAQELLDYFDDFSGFSKKDQVLAFLADINIGNLGRALSTAGELQKTLDKVDFGDESPPFLSSLWKIQIVAFFTYLPIALGPLLSFIYFSCLIIIFILVASRFSTSSSLAYDVTFFAATLTLILVAQHISSKDLFSTAMLDDFFLYNVAWLIPRLLISTHFTTFGLLLIMPLFQLLPESQRPRRYEFYGIWFFCWWFSLFVLSFQSQLSFSTRIIQMVVFAILTALSAAFMPLGRFVFYRVSQLLGIGGITEISKKDLRKKSSIGFTDGKILEAKIEKLMFKEDFNEIIFIGKQVISKLNPKSFPKLMKNLVFAHIITEDFLEAKSLATTFQKTFKTGNNTETAKLINAHIKVQTGDFVAALELINSMDRGKIKSFTNNETALSLLILGKCNVAYKEYVQARKDLENSFEISELPIIKSSAALELAKLSLKMNKQGWINVWNNRIKNINGGKTTSSLKLLTSSIVAMSERNMDESLNKAKKACETNPCSQTFAWLANLYVISNQVDEADKLCEKMMPDSVYYHNLMDLLSQCR